jgi:hypothetical protein
MCVAKIKFLTRKRGQMVTFHEALFNYFQPLKEVEINLHLTLCWKGEGNLHKRAPFLKIVFIKISKAAASHFLISVITPLFGEATHSACVLSPFITSQQP